MNFKKIEDNSNITFQQLTNLPLLSNNQQLLQFLQKSQLTQNQYMQIYKLLFTTQKNYQIITSDYFKNLNILSQNVTNSNYIKNKYSIQPFEYDLDGKVCQYKKSVPQFVIQNTTLPHKIFFRNQNVNLFFSSQYYHKDSLYIDQNLNQIVQLVNKKYQDLNDNNPCRFTFQVIQPPANMVRYINKQLKSWQIVQLPQDFYKTEIKPSQEKLQIYISKNITTYVNQNNQLLKSAVYPCIRNLQRQGIQTTGSNISKLINAFNQNDSNIVKNASTYVSSSLYYMALDVNFDFEGKSKYLQSVYNKKKIKNLNINYYQLQNKLGYYNSLIPNQLVQDLRVYRNNIKSFQTWKGQLDQYLFTSNQKSNIASLLYGKQCNDNNYGFLNQMGVYKVSCQVKINRKNSNNNYQVNSLESLFNNLELNNQKNYIDLFQILVYPYNGIEDFKELKENQNIGVLLPQNLYKKASVGLPDFDDYIQADLDTSNIYMPCYNYEYKSQQDIYQDYQNTNTPALSGKVSFSMLKPNKNYSDFNFMFDKYGQFLTYRTLNKRYYNYNGKAYKQIFADYDNQVQNLGDGWYKVTSIINKKFQGNSLLSFNLNQTWNDLVSSYKNDVIKLEIKNINIEVII